MKLVSKILLSAIMIIIACTSFGVFATWKYSGAPIEEGEADLNLNFAVPDLPEAVYIVTAWDNSSGNQSTVINGYTGTHLRSTATLSSSNNSTASAIVRVRNNANETYAFNAVKYQTADYSNEGIEYVLPVLTHGDEIDAGDYLDFEVQFKYKDNKVASSNVLNSFLNFEFLPVDELPKQEEVAVSGALGQFKDIINNIVADDSLQQLIDQMDNYDDNDRANGSYIGNVTGASDNDVILLEDLFQGNLMLNIDGVDTEVTIMIKRENIDGSTNTGDKNGNELTIYMTTDDLQKTSWWGTQTAPVYASVFTSYDKGETWTQLGDMYEGTAAIKQYNGFPGSGSFDTDTWKSTGSPSRTIEQIIANLKNN